MNETSKRILSAAVALPIYCFLVVSDVFYSIPILIASLLISLGCLWEYYQISSRDEGNRPFIAAGMAMAVAVNLVMYLYAFGRVYGYAAHVPPFDARFIFAVFAIGLPIVFAVHIRKRPVAGGIYSLATTVFGVVFIAFLFSHIILLKALKDGYIYVLILNAIVMLNDSGAYFGGVYFGKHKAGFKVSPNKSWEGYFSGLLTSILSMLIASMVLESFFGKSLFSMVEAAIIGIAISLIGNIGDLAESALKRDGAIKDSGSLIPGHGGFWDVFDSMIVTLPLFYYYLVLKGVQ
ncbi:MAG TPA: phosphatidate cytidylyltransferase [Spirochaetota bacterium]|nr:phosphatidate cytidylyltransferase [Spirochaetota bacterium]OPZ35782.1 MAG: Phosphatidate cytidylyltransferase [Spirochaetes bacterium ADurb.BinA120]HNU92595.1 phosphatidate cytidylyltransferase [Spirochaetota bacterium]HPV98621.1 phosphatidate cytidylyltransferase [Spirochaetota bacterium]